MQKKSSWSKVNEWVRLIGLDRKTIYEEVLEPVVAVLDKLLIRKHAQSKIINNKTQEEEKKKRWKHDKRRKLRSEHWDERRKTREARELIWWSEIVEIFDCWRREEDLLCGWDEEDDPPHCEMLITFPQITKPHNNISTFFYLGLPRPSPTRIRFRKIHSLFNVKKIL